MPSVADLDSTSAGIGNKLINKPTSKRTLAALQKLGTLGSNRTFSATQRGVKV